MSFDFAATTVGIDSENKDSDDGDSPEPDFEANEVASGYIYGGAQPLAVVKQIRGQLGLEALKLYSDDTLEDFDRVIDDNEVSHPMQILEVIYTLSKSTFGKEQLENDHSIGFTNDPKQIPESHDEVQQDFSYALWQEDSGVVDTETLDGSEREALQEMGFELSDLSIKKGSDEIRLLAVNGERLPIAVENDEDIEQAVRVLQSVPDEPSRYTEDGFVESSDPSVFGDSDDDTNGIDEGGHDDTDYPDISLSENPRRVNDMNVAWLRGHNGHPDRFSVAEIDSLRTIQTALAAESDADNTRSSAISRLKERRSALKGGNDDSDDSNEPEGSIEMHDLTEGEGDNGDPTAPEPEQIIAEAQEEASEDPEITPEYAKANYDLSDFSEFDHEVLGEACKEVEQESTLEAVIEGIRQQ